MGRLALGEPQPVQAREDASDHRAGGGGTRHARVHAAGDHAVGVDLAAECRDVRVAAAGVVVLVRVRARGSQLGLAIRVRVSSP